jgi:hypothetical protein
MNVDIIFSEFGPRSAANQKWSTQLSRLDPTYTTAKNYFPEANFIVYTDQKEIANDYPDVEVRHINVDKDSPFTTRNPRYGWHCCDYYQIIGLLESKADVVISVDSDLIFTSDQVRTILPITKKFGVCVPTNQRQLVKIDGIHGSDSDYKIGEDESLGNILTYDAWWISLDPTNTRGREFLTEYKNLMESNHKRAPLQMSRAAWNTGIYPYSMPIQWGVGAGHVGCKNEIILHVGHKEVKHYYLEGEL